MKNVILIVSGLFLAAPLGASDASKILLRGNTVDMEAGRVTGSARASTGDLSVTADAIAFDASRNVLTCDGAVTIQSGSHQITARDCVITLPAGDKRVAYISHGSVRVTPGSSVSVPPARTDLLGRGSDRAEAIQAFRYRMDARTDAGAIPALAPAANPPPAGR